MPGQKISQENDCRELFKAAYLNRYYWNNKFNGYKGNCVYEKNSIKYEAEFSIGKDFKPIIFNLEDPDVVKSISSQLFEVAIHRVKRNFEDIHGENISLKEDREFFKQKVRKNHGL